MPLWTPGAKFLQAHGVEYVVVGGVAAVLQGAPVTTFGIDTLVKVDTENTERLLRAWHAIGDVPP
jgi:hypothetical protein